MTVIVSLAILAFFAICIGIPLGLSRSVDVANAKVQVAQVDACRSLPVLQRSACVTGSQAIADCEKNWKTMNWNSAGSANLSDYSTCVAKVRATFGP